MAGFSVGFVFATNDYVTAARLHAMIDTAVADEENFPIPALINVNSPSCAAGVRIIQTATPATAFTGDLLVNDLGKIDYYSGSAWTPQTSNSLSLINDSGITLATGTPVVLVRTETAATKFTISTAVGNEPDPFGVTLAMVNPAATCLVAFRGKVLMRINNQSLNAGGAVVINSTIGSQLGHVPAAAQSGLSNVFAISLQPGNFAAGEQLVMLMK